VALINRTVGISNKVNIVSWPIRKGVTSTVPRRLIMRLTQRQGILKGYNYSLSWGLREVDHGSAASPLTCDDEIDHHLIVLVLPYDGQSATARTMSPFSTLAEVIGFPYAISL
jgi:hypothetical protein